MKGKGKKNRESSDDESSQCPLMFIDFKSLDHTRACPRYTSVLNRNEEEGIGLDELDALQLELESLLVSVVKRHRQLESEMESLVNWQDVRPREKKLQFKILPETCGKRSKSIEERPTKKMRESISHSASSSTTKNHTMRSKSKNVKMLDYDHADGNLSAHIPVIRNDVPSKFWSFIDDYCGPIKQEDIQVVEDMLKSYDDDHDNYKIPNLGKHYTLKWAQEDRMENKKEDSKSSPSEKKKGLSASNSASPDSKKSGKKSKECKNDPDKCSFGLLTQRLVSCLLEESGFSSADLDFDLDNGDKKANGEKPNLFKSVNFGNAAQLEKKIKKELEEQGLLGDEFYASVPNSNDEDEILNELMRCQSELREVSAYNKSQLTRLLAVAKKEMAKQELEKKLQAVDSEVVEAHRRIISAKQKKRTPTKKERDAAMKALKEREALLKQIESIS